MSAAKRMSKDRIYRALAGEIVAGELPPGTPLSERTLVERFGISRTPIREVIWQLERDGLVDVHVGRGVFVKKIAAEEIIELFQLREALEPLAAALAASHRPEDELAELKDCLLSADADPGRDARELVKLGESLHDALVRWSGNRMLVRIYDTLRRQTQLMRNLLHDSQGTERTSLGEHIAILDALERKDAVGARRAMAVHLRRARLAIIEDLFNAPLEWAEAPRARAVTTSSGGEDVR